MKKILSIVMISAVLLVGNIAAVSASPLKDCKEDFKGKFSQKPETTIETQKFKDLSPKPETTVENQKFKDLKTHLETVRANQVEIQQLSAQARMAQAKAKNYIKALLKTNNLTAEDMTKIQTALETIKADRAALADTKGNIYTETFKIKAAKKNKNFDSAKTCLENIIQVQTTRIADLKTLINDLNAFTQIVDLNNTDNTTNARQE